MLPLLLALYTQHAGRCGVRRWKPRVDSEIANNLAYMKQHASVRTRFLRR